uniref:ATP-dependent Clp protease proteolytic subunit n=1 Tax=Pyramimonas obovata TaxID=1411642 RepID=A0A7S0MTB3_9CHLO|mmetsp:Transcript_13007/g.27497  ORF Transcript_13007/g.27497 Transcript_13007/m.27497 type:complete len:278 (+) Transcript_13007:80-913(+)|eukprot:CAMPEP_0118934836 /NCGR_PEP_ID=MMETSP1169-20130426/14246_1 /TAXON_ID=36882 /ORGANISM="Pyramimonas obovata, Strain CCMP722" /LENGTH=277 /DNA_ID=CAMNT_0006877777 /DNA_START=70 /DNA_END=903 /DNA_ORIENTATION=+
MQARTAINGEVTVRTSARGSSAASVRGAARGLAARHASVNAGQSRVVLPRAQRTASIRGRAVRRLDVQAVIPMLQGDASEQAPPDLPSFLFKERIVYLGMSLVPAVTELILAELLYLQYENADKPITMYINSTGTTKEGQKLGYDTEAFAIYDTMNYVKPPIHTLCVGNAWGEAALLLSSGEKGYRASLPSATLMLKQPISQFRGQASDIEIQRKEIRNTKRQTFEILARNCDKEIEDLERDVNRPLYLPPYQAVEYGLIDKVLDSANVVKNPRRPS